MIRRPPRSTLFPTRRSSDLIFTRRGYWQEAIDANLASVASVGNHFDQLHALDYLTYAYLQTAQDARSEEHTSELQSQSNLVCRLLLEKKKKTKHPQQKYCDY